jgi:biotin transport system substrate-specific component
VNKQLAVSISLPIQQSGISPWLRSVLIAFAGSAFLAVCAHISILLGFTPIPLSLQPFGVLVLGLLLRPRLAAATLCAYLAEGAFGLPVFAPGPLGLAHLLGPTGGYLLAYPMAALLISLLYRRTSRGFAAGLVSAAVGNLIILACGALWLAVATRLSLWTALSVGALPFLAGDALKVAAAAGAARAWQRAWRRTS